MKYLKGALSITLLVVGATWQPVAAGTPANSNLIHLVAVGYDIGQNAKARQMLSDMAQAARESGAVGEVILAGQDQSQLDRAMNQAMSIATQQESPPPARATLTLKTTSVRPGERIVVEHSPLAGADKTAWIGFYKGIETDSKNYLKYTFLNNLTDRIYDVEAPEEPGLYHFRIFPDQGYTPSVVSDEVEVK
ncbi:MAG: hypothetical protein GX571_11240 [Lentisphaerae bacterium]|jgi:hypothetical protein|nr:hypothetical protein [Lentisphaerota bacterium]